MKTEHFVVPLTDLDHGPKVVGWDLSPSWLAQAFTGTEASPRGAPGRLDATLTKNGREVVVRGAVSAPVTVPCARTLDPVELDVKAEIFLLLAPEKAPEARPPKRRRKRTGDEEEGELLSAEESAGDTHPHDRVVLDDFVREFLVLELPMFPLRSEESAAIPHASARREADAVPRVDPRLAPLAALKARLEQKEK